MSSIFWSMRHLGKSKLAYKSAYAVARKLFRHNSVWTIRAGPLKGMKWLCHQDHQFWMPLGIYEQETTQWLLRNLDEGSTFFDIGANAGYFTLLGSVRVGIDGCVVAFEPVPANVEVIEQQVALNDCKNVTIDNRAISSDTGEASFDVEARNANSHLSSVSITHADANVSSRLNIETISLDDYVKASNVSPDVLKIDVEGAELSVLQGATETLGSQRPRIILSTHSAELRKDCSELLIAAEYTITSLPGFEHEMLCYPSAG